MKKLFYISILFVLLLAGCSGGMSQEDSKMSSDGDMNSAAEMEKNQSNDIGFSENEKQVANVDQKSKAEDLADHETDITAAQRMVIYNAEMDITVKNFENARDSLEEKAKGYNGYIVQSDSTRFDDVQQSGRMTFRIPQEHFQAFLTDAEGLSVQVNNRRVSGQDVTEEYVDLESRLKSKRAVEARLLEFMQGAQKTEDLLKISADLADVQEQIEQIAGKKKLLENQAALSTITITLQENEVPVPKIDNQNLNTWQKIKKQFADNINILLAAGSGIIVFFIGNLPILLIFGAVVAAVIYFVRRKALRGQNNDVDSNS